MAWSMRFHSSRLARREAISPPPLPYSREMVTTSLSSAERRAISLGMMYVAGLISGLLGIGSGTFKLLELDSLMRLPIKVSTTTSNFMIGVTAAASAGIYFSHGDLPPLVAAPVALGILVGALIGARLLASISNKLLPLIFLFVLLVSAIEIILHGVGWGAS